MITPGWRAQICQGLAYFDIQVSKNSECKEQLIDAIEADGEKERSMCLKLIYKVKCAVIE